MSAHPLDRVRDALARRGVGLAILFGSHARGQAQPGSDFDMAVSGDVDPLGLASDLSHLLGCEVDIVDLDAASYPLVAELLREGIVLHEGRPGAASSWRTRAILEQEADRPWFERMRDAYMVRVADKGILGW
jgi:predicted nucleotidyltransferase